MSKQATKKQAPAAPPSYEASDEPFGLRPVGPRTIAEALAGAELHPLEEPQAPPDLSFSTERLSSIDAGQARRAALQEYLGQRRGILENGGLMADLVGLEFFELTHRPCGKSWLLPVASGLAEATCPYCRRG